VELIGGFTALQLAVALLAALGASFVCGLLRRSRVVLRLGSFGFPPARGRRRGSEQQEGRAREDQGCRAAEHDQAAGKLKRVDLAGGRVKGAGKGDGVAHGRIIASTS
jgi:hypothetical protein